MKSLNGVAVVAAWSALAVGGVAVAQEAMQWRVEDGGNGHWYRVDDQPETGNGGVCWADARDRARAVGGDLVSLTSPEENTFVVNALSTFPDCPLYSYLGWIGIEGNGMWSDGEPVSWTNWGGGGPSGDGPHATMGFPIVEGVWNDIGGGDGCHSSSDCPLNRWIVEWSADCNGDGIVDYGQILDGTLEDADGNGVPDCCDAGIDCNPPDCDSNGISDADEIAAGVPDCNQNGIPDNCDYEGLYVTPQQAPFGAGNVLSHTFTDVELATKDVSVMVEVRADLDSTAEFATLKIDGETIDVLWVVGGLNCPADGKLIELVIPASEFNAFAKDGEVNVVLEASPLVSPTECADSFARVSIQYSTTFPDCNANGLDDNCELADGMLTDCDGNGIPDSCDNTFADCNANGVPDSCDIADGTLFDCNGNGQPDSCEVASWPDLDCDGDGQLDVCQIASNAALDENEDGILDTCSFALGDFDLDGIVGGSDLAVLLSLWGSKNPPIGDLTGDGMIDGADLAQLLGNWGSYQGVWGSIIEILPDPAVVTDPEWRERIIATGHPWRVRHTKSDIEMLLVPPGTFMMGCSPSLDHPCATDGREEPVHQVTLTQAFYLGRYEVTQAQWTAVMGSNPSSFQGFPDSPSRPIDGISWAMAQSFTNSTGLRLPTEAEWEYACRGGTVSAFNNGTDDDSTMTTLGWTQVNSGGQPRPVGLKLANNLGLYDMHGNIWEWVSDWYSPEYYSGSSGVDPVGPSSGTVRVLRGGSWVYNSLFCRSSNRYDPPPGFNLYNCGFRVARTP